MDIERAMRRDLEYARRQDQSICGDHKHLWPRGGNAIKRSCVAQLRWLKYRQAASFGQLLDGTLGRTQATARRPVRLRKYERDVVTGIKQRNQRARRKLWSAGEN